MNNKKQAISINTEIFGRKEPDLRTIRDGGMAIDASGVGVANGKDRILNQRYKESSELLADAKKEYSKAAVEVSNAGSDLIEKIEELKKTSKDAQRAAKSAMTEIKDQLGKVDSIVGNVELRATQLERIAKAMKTISEISKDEVVMRALSSLSIK